MVDIEPTISLVLHPIKWFAARRVEELATTAAVRQAVFREIVKQHVYRYSHDTGVSKKLDADKAAGIAQRVITTLQPTFDWTTTDPESDTVRASIAKAVTKAAVPLSVWVALQQLQAREPVDPALGFTLSYRNAGEDIHNGGHVAMLQQDFLFFKPFIFSNPTIGASTTRLEARLTAEVKSMVDDRLKDESIENVQFTFGSPFSAINATARAQAHRAQPMGA
jgi:hypothetical protein